MKNKLTKKQRLNYIQIANDLGYDNICLEQLLNVDYEYQIEKIMISARKRLE